jgi:hypothetical protein
VFYIRQQTECGNVGNFQFKNICFLILYVGNTTNYNLTCHFIWVWNFVFFAWETRGCENSLLGFDSFSPTNVAIRTKHPILFFRQWQRCFDKKYKIWEQTAKEILESNKGKIMVKWRKLCNENLYKFWTFTSRSRTIRLRKARYVWRLRSVCARIRLLRSEPSKCEIPTVLHD